MKNLVKFLKEKLGAEGYRYYIELLQNLANERIGAPLLIYGRQGTGKTILGFIYYQVKLTTNREDYPSNVVDEFPDISNHLILTNDEEVYHCLKDKMPSVEITHQEDITFPGAYDFDAFLEALQKEELLQDDDINKPPKTNTLKTVKFLKETLGAEGYEYYIRLLQNLANKHIGVPLLVYGRQGSGKSLLEYIHQKVRAEQPNAKVSLDGFPYEGYNALIFTQDKNVYDLLKDKMPSVEIKRSSENMNCNIIDDEFAALFEGLQNDELLETRC